MEEDGPTFLGGPTISRRWGSNYIFLYRPIELVILLGMGSGPPAPFSGAARGNVKGVRPYNVLATRHSMSLTPLMQVLLALGYYATGSDFLVIGDTPGVSKDATTRVVFRVSKALCAMGLLGRGLVSFSTSDAKGVSTYMLLSHINTELPICFSPTLYAAITFFKCVSLSIRYDFIPIRLKGSLHQEVCEYSVTFPLPHTHP